MAYEFTQAHKERFKKQGEGQQSWTTAIPRSGTKTLKTIKGVSVEFFTDTGEPAKVIENKLATLKLAIAGLQDSGLMFTDTDVKRFRVVCYGGNGTTVPSRGAVYFEDVTDAKPCVLLQLGNRMSNHVTKDTGFSQSLNGVTIAGGARQRPPLVVADRIYDYYKPTKSVSAKARCALNQSFHELGHIVHQLNMPDDYWLNADCAGGKDTLALFQRKNEFDAIKDCGLRFVSQYAGWDAKSLNEYVAEVFAGMLSGVPWAEIDPSGKLMTTYVSLGGPVPPNMPERISRLADFVNGTCGCTGTHESNTKVKYW